MKIIRFKAEHVKKVHVVEITPTGHVVEITGKNGQGKTSVLDAIWWALAGVRSHQPVPINRDHTKAQIKLDLGDLVVEREFKILPPAPGLQDNRLTTRITVTNPEGTSLKSPQTILDKLLGSLSFDPLKFAREDEAEQYRIIQEVCGIDLRASDIQNEHDYTARRVANKTAKDRRAAMTMVVVPRPMPARVDVGELVKERQRREKLNALRADGIRTRETLERQHDARGVEIEKVIETAASHKTAAEQAKATLELQVTRLREEFNRTLAALKTASHAKVDEHQVLVGQFEGRAKNLSTEWQALRKQIDALPATPDPETFTDLDEQLQQADVKNAKAEAAERQADTLKRLVTEAGDAEAESVRLSAEMDQRKMNAAIAVEKAALPIPGLTLEHGRVTLNGLPFAQASDADQLRASCAIAMRGDQELKVIRIRNGSLLDEDSMKILAEMAADADYQVWVETVGTGKSGIVIEDGRVKGKK